MPISGALPANAAFLSDTRNAQRHRVDSKSDSVWQDAWISIAGSDEAVCFAHEKLALFLDGRLIRRQELSTRLGTSGDGPLSDILQAYRRWGSEFPRYLHGDFALALWDARNHRLVLARDAGGFRPLHYSVRGDEFRFASEARGLLAHGDIPLAADQRSIAQRLSRIPETPGSTFFQGIFSVPAGHTVVWEGGRVAVRDFWKPSGISPLRLRDSREYAEGLRSVLEEAVRDRIEDFSAVGSHLSGGLDSSSVTATAARVLDERRGRVSAFTAVPSIAVNDLDFPGFFCDESAHAAATAALHPNIEHVLIPNTSGTLFRNLDRISSAAECPQLTPGNLWWIHAVCANAASRGLRAVLSGARGNFTISWNGDLALSTLIASGRIPAAMRLARARRKNGSTWSATVISGVGPLLPRGIRRTLRRIRGEGGPEGETGLRREFAVSAGVDVREALDGVESLDSNSLRIWCIRRADPGGITAGLRRLTGVEQMDPTADRRVVEFCLSVPEEHYCANGRRRSLIKDAMSGMLPPKVLEERRRGRQSADVLFHLTREKAEIEAELKRLKKVDLAVRCLDLPALESLLHAWPSPPWEDSHLAYVSQLMRAISVGRFIRRLEEGTLFRDRLSEAA